jgi:predicted ATPase
LEEDLEQLAGEFSGRSQYAHNLARMPLVGQLQELQEIYGGSLEEMSHGESFLHLFQRRLVPGGVYLLDEPETPLSPVKQLALIALITDMVRVDCQFIISTHSPILMAVPGAEILSFDQLPPGPVQYEDLEHVRITRDFLNEPDRFLRHFR